MRERTVDLLVFSHISTAFFVSALRSTPVLLLPRSFVDRSFGQRAIDVPDVVDDGGPLRIRVDSVAVLGAEAPFDQEVAFVSGGRVVASVTTRAGEAELSAGLGLESVGVYRVGESAPLEPLAAVEERIFVLSPDGQPLLLFDSGLEDATLRAIAEVASRWRSRRCASARHAAAARFGSASVKWGSRRTSSMPRLVLDEGDAIDISEPFDSVRLLRVAAKMRSARFEIAAIVHRGHVELRSEGFAAMAVDFEMIPTQCSPRGLKNSCLRLPSRAIVWSSRSTT